MPTGILVIAGGPHFLDRRNCLLELRNYSQTLLNGLGWAGNLHC